MLSRRQAIFVSFMLLLLLPVQAFAEEEKETALYSGTYFPSLTISDSGEQTEIPLKVTITSKNGKINEQKQVGIDGRDFEYDKKTKLLELDKEQLAEMAEVRFWSLKDGHTLAIDEMKVETLDNVESRIIFYNFEKNVTKIVHAYKSGDEIHANKKYSNVRLQKYENLTGEVHERKWAIEYRTLFTYMIHLMILGSVLLVIVLVVFIYLQTQEINKIIFKKSSKKLLLLLLLPALFSFSTNALAKTYDLKEVFITQEHASQLADQNQLENYLIAESGIKDQLEKEKQTVQLDTKELVLGLNQPRKQVVEDYRSRTLIIGDYENYIVFTIVLYCTIIALPLVYFLNKRIKIK